MKYGRSLLIALLVIFLTQTAFSQTPAASPDRYVVVGVFRKMENAVRFTDKANKLDFQANYAINPRNKLYYVYIFHSTESRKAFAFMMKVRLETEFKDAWVLKEPLGEGGSVTPTETKTEPVKTEPTKTEPVKTEPVKTEPLKTDSVKLEPDPVITQPAIDSTAIKVAIEEEKQKIAEAAAKVKAKEDSIAAAKALPKPVGKPFFFKMVSNETGEPVVGEIHVYEGGNLNTYQAFPANQVVYLPAPKDPSQVFAVSTLSAGYQEMIRQINYADPAASSAEVGSNEEFVIALPVVHVKMGDYIEFSNVRFFQNSVVLQPDSKEELDGLAELLKQNPRYKVTIHGHCNGDQDRNIVVRGANQDFFTANTSNQRQTVSAKEFTKLRADLVRDYIASQGIDIKRISTIGEGGKALIYPTNSTLSSRNDRVEIEVKRGK